MEKSGLTIRKDLIMKVSGISLVFIIFFLGNEYDGVYLSYCINREAVGGEVDDKNMD